jgi:hypothetical protein
MTGASSNVKLISATVLVLALIGMAVYADQSASPNFGLIMGFLTSTVSGLLAYLKVGKIEQVQQKIQRQVNGNMHRTQSIANEALGALPSDQAAEVLRRVDGPPPEDPPSPPLR